MPVIGGAFSCGFGGPQIRYIGIIRGLAQRNKGRKTSYFDGSRRSHMRRDNPGRHVAVASPATIFRRCREACERPTDDANPALTAPLWPRCAQQKMRWKQPDETILGNPRNHPETEPEYLCCQQRGGKDARRHHMNHSIHSADRATHLKIVVVALVAGIAVAAFGISARSNSSDYTQTAHVVKAGKAIAVTSSNGSVVR
jgi:hypothetical protein